MAEDRIGNAKEEDVMDAHGQLVSAAEGWLRQQGYTVDTVPSTGEHRADVYGYKKDRNGDVTEEVLIECETCDSVCDPHALEQARAFQAWKMRKESRKILLFVPSTCFLYEGESKWVECKKARGTVSKQMTGCSRAATCGVKSYYDSCYHVVISCS
jgi:hypothetical protein